MKLLIILLTAFILSSDFLKSEKAELEIVINDLKSVTGKIYLAIYTDANNFGKPEFAHLRKIFPVKNPFWTKFELKKGDYALAVFQDINENGKLDVNWIGIPTEPYGFSNNPKIGFGPPSFKDVKFKLEQANTKININLR